MSLIWGYRMRWGPFRFLPELSYAGAPVLLVIVDVCRAEWAATITSKGAMSMTDVRRDEKPLKYDEAPDPAFATELLTWKWGDWEERGTKVGRKTAGACPRCGDRMAIYVGIFVGLEESTVWECVCNCRGTHEGRPEGMSGCGQKAWLDLVGWDPEFADGGQK